MKLLYPLLIPIFLASCNQEDKETPIVLALDATSRRSNESAVLTTVGSQVLQIDRGKCKLTFNLIEAGKVKLIGDAIFDAELGKVAYITPAVGTEGKSYIDLYIFGLKIEGTEESWSQKPSVGFVSYEFNTPTTFGAMIQHKRLQLEQPTLILAYWIMHEERVPLATGEEESVESMVGRSKKKDISFLAVMAEPIE